MITEFVTITSETLSASKTPISPTKVINKLPKTLENINEMITTNSEIYDIDKIQRIDLFSIYIFLLRS